MRVIVSNMYSFWDVYVLYTAFWRHLTCFCEYTSWFVWLKPTPQCIITSLYICMNQLTAWYTFQVYLFVFVCWLLHLRLITILNNANIKTCQKPLSSKWGASITHTHNALVHSDVPSSPRFWVHACLRRTVRFTRRKSSDDVCYHGSDVTVTTRHFPVFQICTFNWLRNISGLNQTASI